MKVRQHMSLKWRLQMIGWGLVAAVMGYIVATHAEIEAMQQVAGLIAFMGGGSVLAGVVGIQDHKL